MLHVNTESRQRIQHALRSDRDCDYFSISCGILLPSDAVSILLEFFPTALIAIVEKYVEDALQVHCEFFRIEFGVYRFGMEFRIHNQWINYFLLDFRISLRLRKNRLSMNIIFENQSWNRRERRKFCDVKLIPLLDKYFIDDIREDSWTSYYAIALIPYHHKVNTKQTAILQLTIFIYNMILEKITQNNQNWLKDFILQQR